MTGTPGPPFVIIGGCLIIWFAIVTGFRPVGWAGIILIVGGEVAGIVLAVLSGTYALAAVYAIDLAIQLWLLWQHWRKIRRRIAASLGAKSRALRDALVKRARQAARPRPVLRPAPGGAR